MTEHELYDRNGIYSKMLYKNFDVPQFLSKISKAKIQKLASDSIPCIIVHGGAGEIVDSEVVEKVFACQKSASIGYKILLNGGNSIEAIEAALWWLENDEYFNCGYGSALNELGDVQMDACLMDGTRSICGSVAAVSDIEHPISLAKFVMENYPNTIVVGDGAKTLANCAGMNWLSKGTMVAPTVHRNKDKPQYTSENSFADLTKKKYGTVGCIAWDGFTMAVGTSTGGLHNKNVGRVGDSPLLGCGTFANSEAGCSLTGQGESIIKLGMSRWWNSTTKMWLLEILLHYF
ncbi:isoaspartyl peptidase/L-asparaginase [Cephus cinctus]|uniref:Isoaspartyl peptidase/L-asparaginase n=1 Tax=Cephus cinctus TaxID=211228 RepID=A0AAJ7W296_CEPCN|nr:isoaspartyl peptidase/L-asparaginase [Cephus cinctus]